MTTKCGTLRHFSRNSIGFRSVWVDPKQSGCSDVQVIALDHSVALYVEMCVCWTLPTVLIIGHTISGRLLTRVPTICYGDESFHRLWSVSAWSVVHPYGTVVVYRAIAGNAAVVVKQLVGVLDKCVSAFTADSSYKDMSLSSRLNPEQ